MINYNKLRYFYEVSNTLNFTKAAGALYISQPALSRHISDLEAELGVRLFTRTNRNLLLTEAGEALREECGRIFSGENSIRSRMNQFADSGKGRLEIAFMGIEASFRMQELIGQFKQRYPLIEVHQERMNWGTVEKALQSCRSDIGLMLSLCEAPHDRLIRRSLTRTQLALVLPQCHRLAREAHVEMRQLTGERMIMLSREDSQIPYDMTVRQCREAGFSPVIAGEYPNVETVVMMVHAGAGVAVLSSVAPLAGITGISCVPIKNSPIISVDLVWSPENKNAAIVPFLEMAQAFSWQF